MMGQPLVFSLIDKAVFDYHLIEPGDRILVGASGGKDSTVLVDYLAQRACRPGCGFTYKAVYVQSDFSGPLPGAVRTLFSEWHVPFETVYADVVARLKPGRKMNCWWCSTQRRTELLSYAVKNGYNKLALGHHLDDILETLIMNMVEKSEVSTMPPKLTYDKYPVTIIRPLCYVSVETIKTYAAENGFLNVTCTCAYQDNSGRREARRRLAALTGGSDEQKMHLFTALKHIRSEYLP